MAGPFQQFVSQPNLPSGGVDTSGLSGIGEALQATAQVVEAGLGIRDVVQTQRTADELQALALQAQEGSLTFNELVKDISTGLGVNDKQAVMDAERSLSKLFAGQRQGALTPMMASQRAASLIAERSRQNPRIQQQLAAMGSALGFGRAGGLSTGGGRATGGFGAGMGLTAEFETTLREIAQNNRVSIPDAYNIVVKREADEQTIQSSRVAAANGELSLPSFSLTASAIGHKSLQDPTEEGGTTGFIQQYENDFTSAVTEADKMAVQTRYKQLLENRKLMVTNQVDALRAGLASSDAATFTTGQYTSVLESALRPLESFAKVIELGDVGERQKALAQLSRDQQQLSSAQFNDLLRTLQLGQFVREGGPANQSNFFTEFLPRMRERFTGIDGQRLSSLAAEGDEDAQFLLGAGGIEAVNYALRVWKDYQNGRPTTLGGQVNKEYMDSMADKYRQYRYGNDEDPKAKEKDRNALVDTVNDATMNLDRGVSGLWNKSTVAVYREDSKAAKAHVDVATNRLPAVADGLFSVLPTSGGTMDKDTMTLVYDPSKLSSGVVDKEIFLAVPSAGFVSPARAFQEVELTDAVQFNYDVERMRPGTRLKPAERYTQNRTESYVPLSEQLANMVSHMGAEGFDKWMRSVGLEVFRAKGYKVTVVGEEADGE